MVRNIKDVGRTSRGNVLQVLFKSYDCQSIEFITFVHQLNFDVVISCPSTFDEENVYLLWHPGARLGRVPPAKLDWPWGFSLFRHLFNSQLKQSNNEGDAVSRASVGL